MASQQLDEERIFHVARTMGDPDIRSEYLDQVCAGDQSLRERVEALLAVYEEEQEFLRSAAEPAVTIDHRSLVERPGNTIGRYTLMEQIGEGGMGIVFVAQQERPIRRKVALKVIKPGMDSKAVVARFEAERQALAMMDHPNIAKVLDAGTTESGRPYFAMELVKGVPITEYCDRNKLTVDERLALFVQICHAIQHAHQKGIIHRDIKPPNVLVTLHDTQPVPKIIDFGVAKALNARLTDKTIYTEHLQIVGTLMYMSPEQAELSGLDVDTRSDIYSLGVLLYELLTGTTPFEQHALSQAGFDEQRRIIREEDPPRASDRISSLKDSATTVAESRRTESKKLHRQVKGDLDWIVLKALEKDRSRRYGTANALAEDVLRYLSDEAVTAVPPTLSYRLWKAAAKHKTLVATSLLVFAALLCGLLGTSIAAWRAHVAQLAAENLTRELTATLATLKTEYLDRAVGDALAGDVRACEDSLMLARRVNADDALVRVIHALALMYGGRLREAISELKEAETNDPDNLAVLAASIWANLYNGKVQRVTDISQALSRLEAVGRRPSNDHERLLLAHTKLFGSGLSAAIASLDDIISRHPRWGIAYAIRAEAKTELARRTKNMNDLEEAREDASLGGRYHPDNAFVLSIAMDVYVTSIELARHQGILPASDIQVLEDRATQIALELESRPDYLFGRAMRLIFYRLAQRHAEYTKEYAALKQQGFGGDQPIVARLLIDKDVSKLQAYLRGNPHSFAAHTATALRDVLDGDSASASSALDRLRGEFTDPNQRWLMLDVALVAQNQGLARQLAEAFLGTETTRDAASFNVLDTLMTQFYAGVIGNDELLEACGPFLVERSVAHYAIGMWKLSSARSEDDLGAVREHLEIAADCPIPGWWHVEFAKAYLQLINDGRLPPNKSDSED